MARISERQKTRKAKLHYAVISEPLIKTLMHQSFSFTVSLNNALEDEKEFAGHVARNGKRNGHIFPEEGEPFFYMHVIGNDDDDVAGVMITFDIDKDSDLIITFLETESEPVNVTYTLRFKSLERSDETYIKQWKIRGASIETKLKDLFKLTDTMKTAQDLCIADRPDAICEEYQDKEVMRPLKWCE